MTNEPQQQEGTAAVEPTAPTAISEAPAAFFRALVVAAVVLLALDWLLGSLMWLPFFSGLLGFFVEGLIAGGVAFRFARRARPISRGRLWFGIIMLVAISMSGLLFFEYWHFCGRVGRAPYFSKTRNGVIQKETDETPRLAALAEVQSGTVRAFRDYLAEDYPPGGALGYARWATTSGIATIEFRGESQRIEAGHRGWIWPVRTAIGAILLAVSLALAFDALKSPVPVRNVLLPGEEYEELED